MLSLLRVELRKLFRGKIFWLTVLIYAVSVLGTFIPLSYTGEFLGDEVAIPPTGILEIDESLSGIEQDLDQLSGVLRDLRDSDNFVRQFYSTSSGSFVVVLIFGIAFIFADFLTGILRATLLCGYSRRQVYFAKLLVCIAGGCAFLAINMLLVTIMGAAFYGMALTAGLFYGALCTLLGQCVVMLAFASVGTAFAFLYGNGWSYLATILFFTATGIPTIAALIRGDSYSYATTVLPSVFSVSGVGNIVTLEQMLAMPEMWSARFVIPALLSVAALTALSIWLGVKAFRRKQL